MAGAATVRFRTAAWLRFPEVAVTVTFVVPAAVELATLNAARNHPELPVIPGGRPEAVSVIGPANLLRGAIIQWLLLCLPALQSGLPATWRM